MRHSGSRVLVGALLGGVAALSLGGWASAQESAAPPPVSAGSIVTLPAPAVADFWLTAQVKTGAQGPEFHGFVPDDATLKSLAAIADADVAGLIIASGAPATFGEGLDFATEALAHLAEGRVALRSNVITIKGTAKSAADEAALKALTGSVPAGIVLALSEIAPAPEASPNEAQPAAAAAAQVNPAAASEPAAPAPAASEATPAPEPAAAAASAPAAEPALQAPDAKPAEPAPTVDPAYAFSATREAGGAATLSGSVPAEPALRYFSVLAGNAPTTSVAVETGAPEDFITDAIAGLRALAALNTGKLAFADGKWSLSGSAADDDALASAKSLLGAAPNAADWTVDLSGPPPSDVCRAKVAEFSASHSILFQSGSARMTDESRAALTDLAAILESCPDATIHVEGHTDADGDEKANLALSVARAEAVTAALVAAGVDDTRLYAIGYGESVPIASNDTVDGKRQNRRIVFTVLDEHK